METYTELVMGVTLKQETPDIVIHVLKYMMVSTVKFKPPVLPDHPLFETRNWKSMLHSDSSRFGGFTHSEKKWDKAYEVWKVNIRCNLMNYDNEIEKFWDWLVPHINTRGFVGYWRCEKDEHPIPLFV